MMQLSITYFCGMKTESVQSYFKNFFIENDINLAEDKYLLAVSGGIDSMVLFDLFLKNNINFSVASCNFQLRGKDSDNDLKFVENICIKNSIKTIIPKICNIICVSKPASLSIILFSNIIS